MKNIILYPRAKSILENDSLLWGKFESKEDNAFPLLAIGKALYFKDETKDDTMSSFINNPPFVTQLESYILKTIVDEPNQENPHDELLA